MPGFPYGGMPHYPYAYPPPHGLPPGFPQQQNPGSGQVTPPNGINQMAALANAATFEIERQAEADRRSGNTPPQGSTPQFSGPSMQQNSPADPQQQQQQQHHLPYPYAGWPPVPPGYGYPYMMMPYSQPPSNASSNPSVRLSNDSSPFGSRAPSNSSHEGPTLSASPNSAYPFLGQTLNASEDAFARHRAMNTFPPSTNTSRQPSPELSNRDKSESGSPPPQNGSSQQGYLPFRSSNELSSYTPSGSPMLMPFRGLNLMGQQSHLSSRSNLGGSETPITPYNLSRPVSPVHLPSIKMESLGGDFQQHDLPSHHQHAARPHKSIGPYSGHNASKSRPTSPTLDGNGSLIAQYHLSSTAGTSEGDDHLFMDDQFGRGLHGHLNDILNGSASKGASTSSNPLPPISAMSNAPALTGYSRVSHTRSAPASRAGSPHEGSSSPPSAVTSKPLSSSSEVHLPSLANGDNLWGPPSAKPRTVGWGKTFSMTPMNGN